MFAQANGYIPWPGKLVGKHSRHGLVDFLGTDDSRRILYSKIWPYCDDSKSRFITRENLEYPQFRDAILIAESLSSDLRDNSDCCYRVLIKEDLEEEPDQEKASQEEFEQEKPGSEEPAYEEPRLEEHSEGEIGSRESDVLEYLENLRNDRKSLEGGVEQKFIEQVNFLRRSLKSNLQDYPSAVMALHELHDMRFSELLLVRNYPAVNSIYLICHLHTDHADYIEAAEVKLLATHLMSRFASAFNLPDIPSDFMDDLRSLSNIYRRYTYEFEPKQYQQDEEYVVWEVPGEEGIDLEEPGPEAMLVAEPGQEAMVAEYEEVPPTDLDTGNRGVEETFNNLVYTLRHSLLTDQKDYPTALWALEELLEMTFSQEFLLKHYKAMYLIYDLSRFGSVFPWEGLNKATQVNNLVNKLMVRFFSVFEMPGTTTYDFMVHFCSLYTSDSEPESDGE